MGRRRILRDQGGNEYDRLSKAAVREIIKNPVKAVSDSHYNDYACAYCLESDVFIMRVGYGKTFTLTVVYWSGEEDVAPQEEIFEHGQLEAAIDLFVKLCKK